MKSEYILNKKMIQFWSDPDNGIFLLINHMWRQKDELERYGLRLYYQEVSEEEYNLLVNSQQNNNLAYMYKINEKLFQRLLKYKYIIAKDEATLFQPVWFSQASQYFYKYLMMKYSLEYPSLPSRVLLLPTLRCYGDCVFCITNSKMIKIANELSACDWKFITNEILKFWNPLSIDIVGGEPLIKMDSIQAILKQLKNKSTIVKLITNGELITEDSISILKEALSNLNHNIQISFDSSNRDIFNSIRKNVNYDKVINGINLLNENHLNFGINFTVCKINYSTIESTINFISKYNPKYFTIGPLQVSKKDKTKCESILIDDTEEQRLRKLLNKMSKKYPKIFFKYDKQESVYLNNAPSNSIKEFHRCTGFYEEITIMPNGKYCPCLRATSYDSLIGTDVRNEDLTQIWKNSNLANLYRNIKVTGKCKICEYNSVCNLGCPIDNYIVNNKFGGENPYCSYRRELV